MNLTTPVEETVFARKRFHPEAMIRFGFTKTDGGYRYTCGFLNGDFIAELTVSDRGEIRSRVIDAMNDEEYAPLRNENYQGAYVSSVRAAYADVLRRIAETCCTDVRFVSDQANRIADAIEKRYGVLPDYPWADDPYGEYGVFRHPEDGRWFALLMHIKKSALIRGAAGNADVVNLKRDPDRAGERPYGVFPAWHMNHKHWISVILDDTLTDDDVLELVAESFHLTESKKHRTEATKT